MAQNDAKGYTEDKNTVDSLLNIKVPGFDLTEISYFKTITDFNADFTPAEKVMSHRVQYSNEDVQMIPVFVIRPRKDQYNQSYIRVNDLSLPEHLNDQNLQLELKVYDNSPRDETILNYLKNLSHSFPKKKSGNNDVMIKSLIIGWQMKYRDAINVLDNSESDMSDNYLAAFIRGNHNFAIAEIIAAIESGGIYSTEDNSTIKGYYLKAIEDYSRSIDINPDFPYSYYNRACLRSLILELDTAIVDYSRSIELNPTLGEAYYNRGLLEIFMDSSSGGCQDLSKAGELGIDAAYKVIYKFCKNE